MYKRQDITIGDKVLKAGERVKAKHIRELSKSGVQHLRVPREYLIGKILARDLTNPQTGELLAQANDELTLDKLEKIQAAGVTEFQTIYFNEVNCGPYIANTCLLYTSRCV